MGQILCLLYASGCTGYMPLKLLFTLHSEVRGRNRENGESQRKVNSICVCFLQALALVVFTSHSGIT